MTRIHHFAFGLALAALAGLAAAPAAAATTSAITTHEVVAAETYVQGLADEVSDILSSSRSGAAKETDLRAMIDADLDGEAIAKYTLGALWRTATAEELKEFIALLKTYASSFYQGRLNEYAGAKLGVTGSVANGKKAVVVGSTIRNLKGGDPIQIDWLVVRAGEGFKLLDFRFQGVWIARSWGDQFASVIGNNGGKFAAINNHLKQQMASGGNGVSGAH